MESNRLAEGVLIVGIGNEYRSDDAVGLVVARRLKGFSQPEAQASPQAATAGQIRIIELAGEGTALLEAWRGCERVILVDAVCSGAPPGTIHRFDASAGAIPANLFAASSHAFGVAQGIELARALGQLPRQMLLYGIDGKDFSAGARLSPEAQQAGQVVTEMLARTLARCTR